MKTEVNIVFSSHIHSTLVTFAYMEFSLFFEGANMVVCWSTWNPFYFFDLASVCFKGRNMTNIKAVVCAPCSTWSFEGYVLIEETSQLGLPCMLLEVSILNHTSWRRISNVTREHGMRINRRHIHQIECRRDVMINR